MTPERFEQIARLYDAALELPPEERPSFIDGACGEDEELRREVESLLEADEQAGDFIDAPALGMAPELLEGAEVTRLPPGHAVGRYRVLSPLGAGGMGEVYLAEDERLGRKVALKLLLKEFTDDTERVRRFEREARAASALSHPNILTIYEIGEADGRHFIAAEYVAGETLRARLERGPLEVCEALDLAAQVASALASAHGGGIIHRDIKPENIVVHPDGYAKVLDFGLAKLINRPPSANQPKPSDTRTGLLMGTVQYMSPEQTRGSELVDHRTDIWSLGVVLYEMVAGRAPFEGEDAHRRIVSIREGEPPPLATYAEAVPERLEEVVRKALAKDPDGRYQTAREFLLDLRDLKRMLEVSEEMARSSSPDGAFTSGAFRSDGGRLSRAGVGATARAPQVSSAEVIAGEIKRHKRGFLIASAAFVVLTAVGVFGLYGWLGRARPPDKASSPAPKIVPLTSFPGVEIEPSFSPDGRQIAFAWDGPGGDNYDVYVKLLDAGSPLRLTSHPGEDRSPCWSPDGRHVAFIRYTESENVIALVPALGGAERVLHTVNPPGVRSLGHFLSWSPDGKFLAYSERASPLSPFGIHLLSAESLERRRLTSPPAGAAGDRFPSISPDGKTLAFTRRSNNDTDDLYLAPLSGGEPTRLTSDNSVITGLAWTPDGREVIFSSNRAGARRLWRIPADGGTPEPVPSVEENTANPAVARQGRLLAYTSTLSDTNIWRVEIKGSQGLGGTPSKLISSTRADNSPQYSPDGKRIAFTSSRSGNLEVWACDADGSNPIQLTSFNGPHVGTPRWSPDGRQVAFDSTAEGSRDIYVVGAGGGRPRRLTAEPSADVRPSWSRDGRFVYFGSDRGGGWQVWKAPAEGGPAVQLTKQGGREAFESPDGRFVYYTKEDAPGLWRVPAEGGEEVKVLDGVRQGAWAVWERGVYFVNMEAPSRTSVESYSFAAGRTTKVATVEKELLWSGPSLAATADGRWVLYVQMDQTESDIMLVENFQ